MLQPLQCSHLSTSFPQNCPSTCLKNYRQHLTVLRRKLSNSAKKGSDYSASQLQLLWQLIGPNLPWDFGSVKNSAHVLEHHAQDAARQAGRQSSVGAGSVHQQKGEACAAKTGLEKCKLFILGHPHLILCIDHKPLLATMGEQELADIPNPRLLDFKIKSMAYSFTPMYIPGKDHVTPDALFRRSNSPIAALPVVKP